MPTIEHKIHLKENDCTGCGLCFCVCPHKCIRMKGDSEGFLYPRIDYSRCVSCGQCVSSCNKMSSASKYCTPKKILAAINKNKDVRQKSSSGGVFFAIAQDFIKQSGYVVGAQFASDFSVEHNISNTLEGIKAFQTSKYVQSSIENVLPNIKALLMKGEKVLFSGTPCQVAALHFYLQRPFDNLFCIDFICHGVPSPGLWKKYLKEICNDYKNEIASINFRDKKWSWERFALRIKFKNNQEFCKPLDKDPFLKAFLSNITLRPSCYHCSYRGYNRYADLTLSDFWSAHQHPNIPIDHKGISMLIINNIRSKDLLSNVLNDMSIWELANTEDILKENPSYFSNPKINLRRSDYFRNCENKTIKEVDSIFIKNKLSRTIRIEFSVWKQRIIKIFCGE